jgi:DNA polymerase III sliding clamp (beta) subunit (PCNA family)
MELSVIAETTLVTVTGEGTILIPAKRLLSILREASEGEIAVTVKSGTALVESYAGGGASWQLRLYPAADYPDLPSADTPLSSTSRAELLKALGRVRAALGRDGTRANLMMVNIVNGTATACDGVRLHQVGLDFPLPVQIPGGAVEHLMRILRESPLDQLQVGETDSHLVFRTGSDNFMTGKLFYAFPNTAAQILEPALKNKAELGVARADLEKAVRKVRINADETSSAIGLRLVPPPTADDDAGVVVLARDKAGNTAEARISALWSGAERTVVVNHVFLTDLLGMCSGADVTLMLGPDSAKKRSPVLLRDGTTTGVIMGMPLSLVGL